MATEFNADDGMVATITAHHLYLTIQNKEDPLAFCKPIPKKATDRDALLKAVCGGESKFFLYVTLTFSPVVFLSLPCFLPTTSSSTG